MGERASEGTGTTLRRRGLIAGAAALVAGMAAKRAAEDAPVAADGAVWTLPYAGSITSPVAAFSMTNTGTGLATYASSTGNHAIYGNLDAPAGSGYAGVFGYGSGTGTFGVRGVNGSAGYGVYGLNDFAGGTGVRGDSHDGFPMVGNVTGIANTAAGVLGAGTVGPGVQGQSTGSHGLVGTTSATDGHAGLVGNANKAGGIGLMGIAPNYGQQTVGHAGEFYGNVKIYGGSLLAPIVQASVKHQGDGSYRALPGIVAPEGWIEDFGTGTLAADKAEITLESDFAALIENDYHVFLTSEGPQHLYVSQKSGTGFTVMAMAWAAAAGEPKLAVGGGSFSWRVVGRRKDIASERLAKVAAPTAPRSPTAFDLPKAPEIKPPTTKP